MELFIDSADPKEIQTAWDWGFIDGVTTNPSLAAKVGRPYRQIVLQIFEIVDGPVSLEVIATEYDQMLEQARALAALHPVVVVKIPCTRDGLKAVKTLKKEGIKTNVTLVFSGGQALAVGKLGSDYVSPFVGRLDDIATHAGDDLVSNIRQTYDRYGFGTKILAASIRDLQHLEKMALIGADVATVPFNVLETITNHPLTDKGLQRFLQDWQAAGLELPIE
ncbi:MAG: fructose-6-phosphate aldolase [Candidatus Pacebacteria bacterium CG10_big_fil_rev_8_21_14_0_10_56_10]|nr:MAG: fructose-6-phosphate aldolase [Candidatus Pacebacteria bacterium CG10_big_fil_rev_8_21_14_0_10_56_10]